MAQEIFRTALYELVWSKAVKDVARDLGMSDVGLVKHCKKAGIPVPGRGYWAKVAAGQAVDKEPLPARGPGMPEVLKLGGSPYYDKPLSEEEIREPSPPLLEFAETIDVLRERIAKMVGKVTVRPSLKNPHRVIERLLAKADENRWNSPKFDTPFAKRRLRILNTLFVELERVGCRIDARGHEASEIFVTVGYQNLQLALSRFAPAGRRRPTPVDETDTLMELEVAYWLGGNQQDKIHSCDDESGLLEEKLGDIIIQTILAGEMQYRSSIKRQYDWRLERKAALEKEDARRRREEESADCARQAKILQDRQDRLLKEADDLRKANQIREYVADAKKSSSLRADLDAAKVESWAEWALNEAERIDPISSGRFLQ